MSAYFDKTKNRWIFDFDKVVNGRRVRATKTLPEGWSRAKAEAFNKAETDKLYAVATGTTKERVTIRAAVELYIKYQCPKLKNGNGVIKELARVDWAFKGRYLDELADVARVYAANAVREVKEPDGSTYTVPLSPASIKNKLSYLRAACRYAQKHHGLGAGENLAMAMPTVRNERQEYASRGEMLQIARACKCRHTRALIRLGFYSGMRLGEMMTLGHTGKIQDNAFLLVDTKNGSNRIVPMHPCVRVLCKYLPIPFQKRWMQRQFERARDAAGFGHLHFHDMRHSAASAMINNDVDLYTVGAVLGHKDYRSTKRYSHLATDTLAAAIRKIR
jgi:integrase